MFSVCNMQLSSEPMHTEHKINDDNADNGLSEAGHTRNIKGVCRGWASHLYSKNVSEPKYHPLRRQN